MSQVPAAEWRSPAELVPWDKNPRKNDDAVDSVAESIRRFGFGAPIVANRRDGTIIAGHTRLRAAVKLGLAEVPVRFLDLAPEDAHALSLADNRLGEIATWDDAALAEIIGGISAADIQMVGFTDDDVKRVMLAVESLESQASRVKIPDGKPLTEPVRASQMRIEVLCTREFLTEVYGDKAVSQLLDEWNKHAGVEVHIS